MDADILEQLFGAEVARGDFKSPLSIEDVWKNSYSENTNRKVWAAKYVARHPNLVALELSSFKCGMDAPIYSVVEEIVENSGTPYFCFKDIDENKPAGAIKIRIETIGYFLKRVSGTVGGTQPQDGGHRMPVGGTGAATAVRRRKLRIGDAAGVQTCSSTKRSCSRSTGSPPTTGATAWSSSRSWTNTIRTRRSRGARPANTTTTVSCADTLPEAKLLIGRLLDKLNGGAPLSPDEVNRLLGDYQA